MSEYDADKSGAVEYPPPLNEQEQAVLNVFVDAVTIGDSRLRSMVVDTLYEAADTQLGYDRDRIDFIYGKALIMTERELEDEDTARLEEATANLPSFHETQTEQADEFRRGHIVGRSAISGAEQESSYNPERNQ